MHEQGDGHSHMEMIFPECYVQGYGPRQETTMADTFFMLAGWKVLPNMPVSRLIPYRDQSTLLQKGIDKASYAYMANTLFTSQ